MISGGAYDVAIKRITSNTNPNLFVLVYENYKVTNLEIIPKYFFVPDVVAPRKPLSQKARRAGWKGSNIIYEDIPHQGKISIIKNKILLNKKSVVKTFKDTASLKVNDINRRGWLFDILSCVNSIKSDIFTLNEMYRYEDKLKLKHMNNNNIRSKIRQQLQILRNKGYIKFIGSGVYQKVSNN